MKWVEEGQPVLTCNIQVISREKEGSEARDKVVVSYFLTLTPELKSGSPHSQMLIYIERDKASVAMSTGSSPVLCPLVDIMDFKLSRASAHCPFVRRPLQVGRKRPAFSLRCSSTGRKEQSLFVYEPKYEKVEKNTPSEAPVWLIAMG